MTPEITDSHCHLDFPDFEGQLPQIIANAAEAGVLHDVFKQLFIDPIGHRYGLMCCVAVSTSPSGCGMGPDKLFFSIGKLRCRSHHGGRQGRPDGIGVRRQ